jgi:uncharacterized membrane protein YhaH (DUF805 family)
MSLAQLLFSFRGRLNRKSYWMTVIVTMAIILLLLLLALIMIREQRFEFAVFTVIILLILYIPLIWIGLAIGAKRLHDRDKSAWWLLVFYALPGILAVQATRWMTWHSSFCMWSASPSRSGPSSNSVACAAREAPIDLALIP